jgi:hypothetical protein
VATEALEPPPSPTGADKVVGVALAAVGDAPLVGSTVAGLIEQLFGTPYARRQEAWLRRVHEIIVELQQRGTDFDELSKRQEFVTAVHDATRIALGEHLEAKLDMLKAVIINAAVRPQDPVSDLWTLRYLQWIDELEPEHVVVLGFSSDPKQWLVEHGLETPEYMSGPRRTVLGLARLPYPNDVLDLILEDLARLRLADVGSGMVTGGAIYDPWITERSRRFLDWLTVV